MPNLEDILAGAFASVISQSVGDPSDMAKVRRLLCLRLYLCLFAGTFV